MGNLANLDWVFVLTVVLTGIVVVFFALVLLVIVVMLFGKLMTGLKGKAKPKAEKAAPAAPSAPAAPTAAAANGVSGSVVAAIAGAIAAIFSSEGNGKRFVIRSIRPARTDNSAWSAAGKADNTRPF